MVSTGFLQFAQKSKETAPLWVSRFSLTHKCRNILYKNVTIRSLLGCYFPEWDRICSDKD